LEEPQKKKAPKTLDPKNWGKWETPEFQMRPRNLLVPNGKFKERLSGDFNPSVNWMKTQRAKLHLSTSFGNWKPITLGIKRGLEPLILN